MNKTLLTLLKQQASVFVFLILSLAINFVTNIILSRILGPASYGDISVVLQVVFFAVPFILMGTEFSILRFVPEYLKKKEYSMYGAFKTWIYTVVKRNILILIIPYMIITLALLLLLKIQWISFSDVHPIFFAFWLAPLMATLALQSSFFNAIKHSVLLSFSSLIYSILFLFALVAFLLFYHQVNIYWIIAIGGMISIIVLTYQHIILSNLLPKHPIHEGETPITIWRNTSINLMFNSIAFVGLASLEIVMMELLSPSEKSVGHFAALMSILLIFDLARTAPMIVLNSVINGYLSTRRITELAAIVKGINRFKNIMALIMGTLIIIYGRKILGWFGPGYASVYPSLIILICAQFINLLLGIPKLYLLLGGLEKKALNLTIAQASIAIILNVIFIPLFQVRGAIIAMNLALVSVNIVALIMVYKKWKFWTSAT